MKILVAGGAGYIGSALVPVLLDRGHEVEVIDLCWFGNNLPAGVKCYQKDLYECQAEDLKKYDQVIFLAGLSNDPMAEYRPDLNFVQNGAIPAYLSFIAKQAGVRRFIYASSCSVYGFSPDRNMIENDPVDCDYPYGISKLQGEWAAMKMADNKFSVIALRQGTVGGHSPRMRFDLLINTMFKTAMVDRKITINNPDIWRPVYDIRDAVQAYVRAILAPERLSGVFNVCSGNHQVGEIGAIIHDLMEAFVGPIDLETKKISDKRNYRVSIEGAKRALGFEPGYSISDTVMSLLAHRPQYEHKYTDDRCYNVRIFKGLFPR